MTLTVTEKIVRAIADAEETSPEDLDIILHNWVDTDAVRQLVNHDNNSWELQVEVPNHTVTVTGDGIVHVDGVQRRSIFAN